MTKNYDPLRDDKYLFGKKIDEFNHDHVKKIDEEIERRIKGDKVLVVASGKEIFAIDGKDIRKVAERSGWVRALCLHDGRLYDGGDYKAVYETLGNKRVAERKDCVHALCSHNGKLYDGGEYRAVYETLSDKEVDERSDWVRALCLHDGRLYDGGDYKAVYETLSNKKVAERDGWVRALCSDGSNNLYDAGSYGIYDTLNNCRVIETKKEVDALCFYNGKLHYASGKEIYDITGNLIGTFSNSITAMISVEREVVGL